MGVNSSVGWGAEVVATVSVVPLGGGISGIPVVDRLIKVPNNCEISLSADVSSEISLPEQLWNSRKHPLTKLAWFGKTAGSIAGTKAIVHRRAVFGGGGGQTRKDSH